MRSRTRFFQTSILAWISLLAMPSSSALLNARMQQTAGIVGPSFNCNSATGEVEKRICEDRNLSALDVEYIRLYNQRLQREGGLASQIQSSEEARRQTRNNCINERVDASLIRSSEVECLAVWYHVRIAEQSELPAVSPDKWTPALVSAAPIYVDPDRARNPKLEREIYLKKPGVEGLIRMKFGDSEPADIDPSVRYYIYRNVLGSLTYVAQYRGDGHLDLLYFFNKDGSLAAAERRFDTKKAGGNVYVEIETAFIDSVGRETQRKVIAYEQGKISVIQSALSPPHLEKPPFGTFAALYNSKFKSAETLDANKLGYCYFNLADGYPTVTRVVNFAPQPLDFYQQSSRTMNLQRFDYVWVTREPKKGVAQDLGTLDGKRVYSINYPGGDFHVVVVERQSGRYLPLMYFSPQTTIARLAILPSVGRQILAYSSAIAGNGGFTDDWYFILDQGIPKRVEFQPILVAELQKIYPEIKGTRPRGNFDLSGIRRFDVANLTFTSPVWKDDDANDSPSEKVQVVFQIRNGELVVKSSHREKSTGLF